MTAQKSFPLHRPSPASRIRLLCFPFAGGSAAIYREWTKALAPAIEVMAYEPKGRSTRFRDPPESSLSATLDEVVRGLDEIDRTHGKKPLALFGHSMGGRMAFAFASSKRRPIEHVFLSAARPPFIASRMRSTHDDADLVKELIRLGGTPKEILDNAEMRALVLPMMRADFAIVETELSRQPIDVPLTVFAGEHDEEATVEATKRWAELTTNAFHYELVPQKHFYLEQERARILELIARSIGSDTREV